ncbi:hypothetical protein [Streptomyces sp. NBC_01431]|uniref:hypothetical protein n=1 Tax=Streptomyces sp. NBC_01431 TaxID=2903863 RepID=UPI002E2EA538|nr:hypothetical protein [Streptomyces sp. NBC_01431]
MPSTPAAARPGRSSQAVAPVTEDHLAHLAFQVCGERRAVTAPGVSSAIRWASIAALLG